MAKRKQGFIRGTGAHRRTEDITLDDMDLDFSFTSGEIDLELNLEEIDLEISLEELAAWLDDPG